MLPQLNRVMVAKTPVEVECARDAGGRSLADLESASFGINACMLRYAPVSGSDWCKICPVSR